MSAAVGPKLSRTAGFVAYSRKLFNEVTGNIIHRNCTLTIYMKFILTICTNCILTICMNCILTIYTNCILKIHTNFLMKLLCCIKRTGYRTNRTQHCRTSPQNIALIIWKNWRERIKSANTTIKCRNLVLFTPTQIAYCCRNYSLILTAQYSESIHSNDSISSKITC